MVKTARACFIGFLLYSTFFIMLKVWCWCNKMEEEGYLEAIESMRNKRRGYQSQCFGRSTLNIRTTVDHLLCDGGNGREEMSEHMSSI